MGYQLKAVEPYGNMQAVLWNKVTNQLTAASDNRGVGLGQTANVSDNAQIDQ